MIGGLGFIKLVGYFAIFLVIGGMLINAISAVNYGVKTGDFKPLLTATGGRILQIDQRMKKSVEFLSDESAQNRIDPMLRLRMVEMMKQQLIFDFIILLVIGYSLFRLGNWMGGNLQFNPFFDVLLIIAIMLIFAGLEMAYTYWVTKEVVYPLTGVWEFIKNLPVIFHVPDLNAPLVLGNSTGLI